MIIYHHGAYGLSSLSRIHGSAVYKAVLPAVISTAFLILFHYLRESNGRIAKHPYVITAFVTFFSFLLTFRLNYAYQRYWEGATVIHQMLSKWLDCAMHLAAFHYQSEAYDDIIPNSTGKQANSTSGLTAKKKVRHYQTPSMQETASLIDQLMSEEEEAESKSKKRPWWKSRRESLATTVEKHSSERQTAKHIDSVNLDKSAMLKRIPVPMRFQDQFTSGTPRGKDGRGSLTRSSANRSIPQGAAFHKPAPSLFLQEMAHLFSLLTGVAMSTLRNDREWAEIPLVEYFPGKPWPPMDPDAESEEIKSKYNGGSFVGQTIDFCLSMDRSEDYRTLYNAARPFGVLGGVSDKEIKMLQRARGPYAKMALCTMWIQEFISREYLNGSTGKVAPPIISRLYQYISDGAVGYNQARKISYILFPFPHGQMVSFFSLTIIFVFPILYSTFTKTLWIACLLNFCNVVCFMGLHEVARELENPFVNTPNDLPLLTYQAQFNEALVTIYAGYHPDSWNSEGASSEK